MTASNRASQALELRNAALNVLGAEATMVEVGGLPGRFPSATLGELDILHRTPFQRIPRSPDFLKYAGALLRQKGYRSRKYRPYGLDIWLRNKKVLNVEWSADDAELDIVSFQRGIWEEVLIGSTLKTGT